MTKGIKLLVIFIVLLAAVMGAIFWSSTPGKTSLGVDGTYAISSGMGERGKQLSEVQAKKFLSELDADLRYDKALTFEHIEEYYRVYDSNRELLTQLDDYLLGGNVCRRLIDYHRLVNGIANGDIEVLKELASNESPYIFPGHKEKLKMILCSEENRQIFQNRHTELQNFEDIVEIYRAVMD